MALATIEGVAGSTRSSTATHFLWLSLLADAVAAGTIWRRWGSDAAGRYLFLGLPLIGWVYLGVDVLTIALAVGGVALATSDRERLGGLALTLAILTKIWPVVLLPGLLLAGRRRTLRWSLVLTTTFTLAWMAWGGIGAPAQVLTFRGAPGWEVESTVGAVVWTIRGGPVVYSRDTPRVGVAPVWAKAGLLALLVVGVAAVWRVSRRDDSELWGAPALAAVSALLFAAPIFSYP